MSERRLQSPSPGASSEESGTFATRPEAHSAEAMKDAISRCGSTMRSDYRGSGSDAGEILTLQRAAYVTEAQAHRAFDLPALTQSLEELQAELGQPDVVAIGVRLEPVSSEPFASAARGPRSNWDA